MCRYIAGDALGFRRGFFAAAQKSPKNIEPFLLHSLRVQYDEAVVKLHTAGFAIWDFIERSNRKVKQAAKCTTCTIS